MLWSLFAFLGQMCADESFQSRFGGAGKMIKRAAAFAGGAKHLKAWSFSLERHVAS